MELARSLVIPRALCGRPTGRAPLRIVHQTLAGEERLLAGREGELLSAVATGQSAILVHALQTLLRWDAVTARRAVRAERRSGARGSRGTARPVRSGRSPGLAEKIRATSRVLRGFVRFILEPQEGNRRRAVMSNEPRRLASLALTPLLLLTVFACTSGGAPATSPSGAPSVAPSPSASDAPSPSAAGGIDHKTGVADVLLRDDEGGGLMMAG